MCAVSRHPTANNMDLSLGSLASWPFDWTWKAGQKCDLSAMTSEELRPFLYSKESQ